MRYSSLWLSVTGLILNLFPLWMYFKEKRPNLRQVKMFLSMTISVICMNLVCVIYSRVIPFTLEHPVLEPIFGWLASIAIAVTPYFFLQYINSIFYYDSPRKNIRLISLLPELFTLLLVALFGPIVYCAGRTLVLGPGRGVLLLVIPHLVFLSLALAEGITLRNSVSRRHLRALMVILAIFLLALGLFLFTAILPVYGFLLSLIPVFCQYTLQGKGTLIDPETGLRNYNAFRTSVITRISNQKPFRLILIHSPDLSSKVTSREEKFGKALMEKLTALLSGIAKSNPVYRIGEDNFAILFDERNERLTKEIEIDLSARFAQPIPAEGERVSIRIWACRCDVPDDAQTMNDIEIMIELLENNQEYYGVNDSVMRTMDLEKEKQFRDEVHNVSQAIINNRLEVFYQPILSVATGRFESAEALVRMKDETGAYISPGRFIPAAERSGIITRIGRCVLEEVCSFLSEKELEVLGVKYIEANLSVEECIQENLPQVIREIMARNNTAPERLNLEVTESANEAASELMMRNIIEINENLGVELSLDDFGTGYSSISRLISMPVSIIKIDRSLLLNAMENENGRIMFERLCEMLHNMGRKIVCEGVETREQDAFVKSNGIEYIQGYLYSRPIPKEQYLDFLRAFASQQKPAA
ncbi:MAG: GGDEF domain-containing protein [Solobacterium sp.]|nr:GGDEF domain-containing protein [Solobacterium sp.]